MTLTPTCCCGLAPLRFARNSLRLSLPRLAPGLLVAALAALTLIGCKDEDDDGDPVVCVVAGVEHEVGDTFPSADGCNTCSCGNDGTVACTTRACVTTCNHEGETLQVGDVVDAADGCNTCTCGADGQVACTEKVCPCDPATDWWRSYTATTTEACATAELDCLVHTEVFRNACGCGCEQSVDCGRVIRCAPPGCDPSTVQSVCPFSTIDSSVKCSVEAPCPSDGTLCFQPGASIGCGMCQNPPEEESCASDAACPEGSICQPLRCACAGQTTCVPGCSADADCGLGEVCGSDHRCRPAPCGAGAACPADFDCQGGGCARRGCSSSTECDGFCVGGSCFAEQGFCSFLPP